MLNSLLKKTEAKAAKTKTEVKDEARAKAQAATHASDKAKEHVNENSAIFGAKSETSIGNKISADKKSISSKGEVKSSSKVKAKASKNK